MFQIVDKEIDIGRGGGGDNFLGLFQLLSLQICWESWPRGVSLSQVKPLVWVEAQVERHSRSRIEIMVKARSQFKERRYVYDVSTLVFIF